MLLVEKLIHAKWTRVGGVINTYRADVGQDRIYAFWLSFGPIVTVTSVEGMDVYGGPVAVAVWNLAAEGRIPLQMPPPAAPMPREP